MRRMTALVIALTLLLTFAVPPRPANAVIPVYDAINWIENALQVLQQVYEIYQRYEQLYNDYQRYLTMVKNLDKFDELTFQNLLGLTAAVNQILQYGESLGHTLEDIDAQFADTFPGYEPVLGDDALEIFEHRNKRTLDTLRYSMDALERISWNTIPAQDVLVHIQEDAESAEGNLEALSAVNEYLHQQSGQLAKISQQLSLETNVQAIYWAYRVDQDASDRATVSQWISNGTGEVPPYEGAGLRGIPASWPWPCYGCGRSLRRPGR